MLVVRNMCYSIGSKEIIKDIDFEIEMGSLCVIVGPNGSGKSSILRCLSGWKPPTKGNISLNGIQLSDMSSLERASYISFLQQRPSLSESIPIQDLVAAARYRFSESPHQSRLQARSFLQQNNLQQIVDRDWRTLSGGEAQRVALICLQAQDAKIWLLDEPANHLDPAVQGNIYQSLIEEWHSGRTIILVTHNINLILSSVTPEQYDKVRIIGLQKSQIHFDCFINDNHLCEYFSKLYQVHVEKIQCFGHTYFVFGNPL